MVSKKMKSCMAAVCILVFLLGGCHKENKVAEDGQSMPEIIVGCDKYPPFNYIGTDGQPTGLDVDLATEAFRRIGYQATFEFVDWSNKKELLEDGTIDCIWCCFSMDGREDIYRWVGPYMMSNQVVAVMPESDIYTVEDLADKTVAVQVTTKPEEIFLVHEDDWHIREIFSLQNRELIYAFLSKGYVDAVAAHEISVREYMSDFNVEYRILEEPLQTVGLGVAFSLEDERSIDALLEQSLLEMQNDGTTEAIIRKYLGDTASSSLPENSEVSLNSQKVSFINQNVLENQFDLLAKNVNYSENLLNILENLNIYTVNASYSEVAGYDS